MHLAASVPSDSEICHKTQEVFGRRPCLWQIQVTQAILRADQDVVLILATGSGKTLTFWMPLLFRTQGIQIIVTPLNILSTQNVAGLIKLGIKGLALSAETATSENFKVRITEQECRFYLNIFYVGFRGRSISHCRNQPWDSHEGKWGLWQVMEEQTVHVSDYKYHMGRGTLCQQMGWLPPRVQVCRTPMISYTCQHFLFYDIRNTSTCSPRWHQWHHATSQKNVYYSPLEWPVQCLSCCTRIPIPHEQLPRSCLPRTG